MKNPLSRRTPPTEQFDEDAVRRPRLSSRLRLVPFAVLVVCALTAGIVGKIADVPLVDPVAAAAEAKAGAAKAAKKAAKKEKRACTPSFDPGRAKTDPWGPGRRQASEKVFKKRMKKEDAAYVAGRNGFAFFTDYQSNDFSQSIGRVRQSAAEERAWAKFFVKAQKTARANGGDFRVVIAPSKGEVYRQQLPSWAQPLRGRTSLEALIADHPEVSWIDTRTALRKAARKNATYEALNSHWTPYGGYVAWDAITTCLRLTPTFASLGVPAISGVEKTPSLNEFAPQGVEDRGDRTVPVYPAPHPTTTITSIDTGAAIASLPDDTVDMTVLPVRTTTTGAQDPGSLLALRDSTGSGLSPLWSTSFATTIQYSHGLGTETKPPRAISLIKQYKPTLTLFVMTERYLDYPAPR